MCYTHNITYYYSEESILSRVASFISYYDARIRLMSHGSLHCNRELSELSDVSAMGSGSQRSRPMCRIEWCSDPAVSCAYCHAVGGKGQSQTQSQSQSKKVVQHCLHDLYKQGLISVTSVPGVENVPVPVPGVGDVRDRGNGINRVVRRIIVNSASDVILPTLIRLQKDCECVICT